MICWCNANYVFRRLPQSNDSDNDVDGKDYDRACY